MNLLLISIDSLRVDFVSRTNPAIHTPLFDALSRAFSFSDRCFSVSSATRPVHTTLFTGLYPFEHGVVSQRTARMRPGLVNLFDLLAKAGFQVAGFSQAAQVFAGLDYAQWIRPFDEQAVRQALFSPGQRGVFLHYWETHTPYGAVDGKAMGATAALLRQGRRAEVIAAYQRAVIRVFERHLAPLLRELPLDQWMVLICGDHGESWTDHEPYHGQTLDNSVLRVPLYLHLPFSGNPPLAAPLVSLVDVFPTVDAVLGLGSSYRGFGRDLRLPERPLHYLAELDPGRSQDPGPGLLAPGSAPPAKGRQWALFDAQHKFTCWEGTGTHRLEQTLSGAVLPLAAGAAERFLAHHRGMIAGSSYGGSWDLGAERDAMLDQRLRELGYL